MLWLIFEVRYPKYIQVCGYINQFFGLFGTVFFKTQRNEKWDYSGNKFISFILWVLVRNLNFFNCIHKKGVSTHFNSDRYCPFFNIYHVTLWQHFGTLCGAFLYVVSQYSTLYQSSSIGSWDQNFRFFIFAFIFYNLCFGDFEW